MVKLTNKIQTEYANEKVYNSNLLTYRFINIEDLKKDQNNPNFNCQDLEKHLDLYLQVMQAYALNLKYITSGLYSRTCKIR